MRSAFLAVLLAFFLCGNLSAQEPKVRTSLAKQDAIWVGQRVTLIVELLAPGFFSGAPTFDLPNAPGLLLTPPVGSPIVSNETMDGVSYTVQRHEVSVFAHRVGEQVIPGFTVRLQFKRQPLDKEPVAVAVQTAPVHFLTKAPPGAVKLGNLISAHNLEAVEMWQPEPGKAKAGDAFTRTITYRAPDIPGMAFPPFLAGKIDGLGIYPKLPEILDASERGSLTGQRRDTIIYVCQRPGQYVIPAARLTWFDLDAQQLRTIDFVSHSFEVAPNAVLAGGTAASRASANTGAPSLIFGFLAAVSINALACLGWKTRSVWRPLVDVFRPTSLAPLNPADGDSAP